MLSILSCSCWSPVMSSLKKCLFRSSDHFLIRFFLFVCLFVLMLSCMSPLYILDIKPLLDIPFVNNFSHSIGGLYVLLVVSFSVQKLFSIMYSHLFIFAFFSPCLRSHIQKILQRLISKSILLMFSSRSCMLQVLFKSRIHFEFTVVCGVRKCSSFILLQVAV